MSVTATVEGIFRAADRAIDGATAYLIPSAVFSSPPQVGDAIPTQSAIASCITGPANGSNGAYRFIGVPQQEYYVGVAFSGLTGWDYHNASAIGLGASGQLVLNTSPAFSGTMLDCLVGGNPVFRVSTGPSGTTHFCSGNIALNGPWDFFTKNATPPCGLKIGQSPANMLTPASGAFTWLNLNDRWGIGHLAANNIVDPGPDYPSLGLANKGGNSLVFFDLIQNYIPLWCDSSGETHFSHNNPNSGGTAINFTLARRGPTPYTIDGTYSVGWRTQLADNNGVGFDGMYMYNVVDDPSHPPSTSINLQNVVSGSHVVAYVITKWGASVFPVDPTLAGGNRAVVSVGDGFQPNPVLWAGSPFGTMLGIAAKSGFGGSLLDIQVNQLRVSSMTAGGQLIQVATDALTGSVSYPLRLQKQLTTGMSAIGLAAGIQFYLPNSAGTQAERGTIQHVLENVTPGSEASHFTFTTSAGGAEVTPLFVGPLNVSVANDLHVDTGFIYTQITAPATATHGVINLGSGGFLGGGGSNFAGAAAGTEIAVNAGGSFTGNLLDLQKSGSTVFLVDYFGDVAIGGQVGGNGTPFALNYQKTKMVSDANFTVPVSGYVAPILEVTSAVTLTGTRNVVLPLTAGATVWVINSTTGAQAIQVIGASGTGITIAATKAAHLFCDGTQWRRLSADV